MSPKNNKRSSTTKYVEEEEEEEPISFNCRFKQPSSEQILKALCKNTTGRRLKADKQFELLLKHFDALPKPKTSSDWLVQFHEQG